MGGSSWLSNDARVALADSLAMRAVSHRFDVVECEMVPVRRSRSADVPVLCKSLASQMLLKGNDVRFRLAPISTELDATS